MPTTIGALAVHLAQKHDDTVNAAVHALATYAYTIGVDMSGPLLPVSVELTDDQARRLTELYEAHLY